MKKIVKLLNKVVLRNNRCCKQVTNSYMLKVKSVCDMGVFSKYV